MDLKTTLILEPTIGGYNPRSDRSEYQVSMKDGKLYFNGVEVVQRKFEDLNETQREIFEESIELDEDDDDDEDDEGDFDKKIKDAYEALSLSEQMKFSIKGWDGYPPIIEDEPLLMEISDTILILTYEQNSSLCSEYIVSSENTLRANGKEIYLPTTGSSFCSTDFLQMFEDLNSNV